MRSKIKKVLRSIYLRVRQYQHNRFIKWVYRSERERYYNHTARLIPENQNSKVSIVVPVYNPKKRYIEALISSIYAQGYQNWELVFADGSTEAELSEYAKACALRDPRIVYKKIKNRGIAGNTNAAIAIATGDYIAFMDNDDTLDPDALAETVTVFENNPEYGLVYTDEDKLSDDGEDYLNPHFKPGFSLDMLRNVNYITHFVVVRKSIVDELKGIRLGFDGAQDFDFLLRAVDLGVKFAHVPMILYHWRASESSTAADFSAKEHILSAGTRALDDHYNRNKITNVKNIAIKNRPGFYRPIYDVSKSHKRAIVLDISRFGLRLDEEEYIIQRLNLLHDVEKYGIKVLKKENLGTATFDTIMHIETPSIPANDKQDVISMFELAEETNIYRVAPKITYHGIINSLGNLKIFHNSSKNNFFGSTEWVRNTNEINKNIYVETKYADHSGRNVAWSHSEFIEFKTKARKNFTKSQLEEFGNPNVEGIKEINLVQNDYIRDYIEEKT